jgi:uncharacterized membrane protein YagU involved in acid resistance
MNKHATRQPSWVSTIIRGAVAGAIATLAMSIPMLLAGRLGVMGTQPPEAIVQRTLGWTSRLPWRTAETDALSSAAHVGFGAAAGIGFALARQALPAASLPGAGIVYALGIWASAYLGWVPAMGILPRADRDRPGRPIVMIVAHIVYGVILGLLTRRGPQPRID